MARRARISKVFGILRGLCENQEVLESLEPFQQEYLRLHRNIKEKKPCASSSSTVGEEVISHLLLENVDDSLAILESADNFSIGSPPGFKSKARPRLRYVRAVTDIGKLTSGTEAQ